MSDRAFPRRDESGRIEDRREFLGMTLAGVVAGGALVLVAEALFALLWPGRLGAGSGWLAGIPAVMLFVKEFSAWRGVRGRIPVTAGSAVLALVLGLLAAGLTGPLPDALSGFLGMAVFAVVYASVWFSWIRTLA